jgi:hypothetical protein
MYSIKGKSSFFMWCVCLPAGKYSLKSKIKKSYFSIVKTAQIWSVGCWGLMTEKVLIQEIMKIVETHRKLDLDDIAAQLKVPKKEVNNCVSDIIKTIKDTILPYSEIKICDLSQELGFSPIFVLTFLKKLIKDGTIRGRLDMVNKSLVIPIENPSSDTHKSDVQELERYHKFLVEERQRKIIERQRINQLMKNSAITGITQAAFGSPVVASNTSIETTNLMNQSSALTSEINQLSFKIKKMERETPELVEWWRDLDMEKYGNIISFLLNMYRDQGFLPPEKELEIRVQKKLKLGKTKEQSIEELNDEELEKFSSTS